ncbi:MAG: LamG-like jellyroll fold domain-containing protein [Deltaproteobacteria bacterium]|nr:LamG-like jellyroll fold domain-containing protein [Deltaproteobacteria bacterium]
MHLTGNLQQNLEKLTIGGTYWGDTDTTNGSMDEVRIWNVARTQGEIQAALAVPLAGNESGLVGYWKFDETEDLGVGGDGQDDFRDFSGNENHVDFKFQASYPYMGNTTVSWTAAMVESPGRRTMEVWILAGDQLTMGRPGVRQGSAARPAIIGWCAHRILNPKPLLRLLLSTPQDARVMPSIHADWHFEGEVGEGVLEYDTWYHVAVVYNGSKITTFTVNGLS